MAIHGGFSNGARATTGVETIKPYDLVYMDGRKRFRTQSHCSKVAPPTLKITSMSSSIFLRALGDWPA